MKRKMTVFGLTVVLCSLVATTVEAGGWGRGRFFTRANSYGTATPHTYHAPTPYYRTPHHYPTAEELYPKYYGSFHYRHLDNIGIPNGDIGIRGNGIYMSPW
jgi:hypothetical protein